MTRRQLLATFAFVAAGTRLVRAQKPDSGAGLTTVTLLIDGMI